MSIFEDKLNSATVHEEIDAKILFESFLLKRNDSYYSFINLTHDLSEISDHYVAEFPRYMTKCREYNEVKTFLGIPFFKSFGNMYNLCAKIISNENSLEILIFGHEEYENIKKLVMSFISKHPDVSVQLKLESPITEYIYPEIIEKYNFWQIVKEIFVKVNYKIDE